jgi:hypothetical protein
MSQQKDDGNQTGIPTSGVHGRTPACLKVSIVKIECDAVSDKARLAGTDNTVCCIVSIGVGYSYRRLAEHRIGKYSCEGEVKVQYPDISLWDGSIEWTPYLEFNFWDSEKGDPQSLSDDFLGAFRVDVNATESTLAVTAWREDSTYGGRMDNGDHVIIIDGSGSKYTIQVRVELRHTSTP